MAISVEARGPEVGRHAVEPEGPSRVVLAVIGVCAAATETWTMARIDRSDLNAYGPGCPYHGYSSMVSHFRQRAIDELGHARLVPHGSRCLMFNALYKASFFRVVRRGGNLPRRRRFKSKHEGLMEFRRLGMVDYWAVGWACS